MQLEKDLLGGFYSIRKLFDAQKVTTKAQQAVFQVKFYNNKKFVNFMNWHKISELYDLEVEYVENKNILFIVNLFIHSHVFVPEFKNKSSLSGIYISSDRTRNKKLFFLSTKEICSYLRMVGNDYPVGIHMHKNFAVNDDGTINYDYDFNVFLE